MTADFSCCLENGLLQKVERRKEWEDQLGRRALKRSRDDSGLDFGDNMNSEK